MLCCSSNDRVFSVALKNPQSSSEEGAAAVLNLLPANQEEKAGERTNARIPSSIASRRSWLCLRVVSLKGKDEGWVKDKRPWNPGPVLRTVSLPINQVLEVTLSYRKDAIDRGCARWLKGGRQRGLSDIGFSCDTWRVGWILIDDQGWRQTADGLMIFSMEKGLMKREASFLGVSGK